MCLPNKHEDPLPQVSRACWKGFTSSFPRLCSYEDHFSNSSFFLGPKRQGSPELPTAHCSFHLIWSKIPRIWQRHPTPASKARLGHPCQYTRWMGRVRSRNISSMSPFGETEETEGSSDTPSVFGVPARREGEVRKTWHERSSS